MLFILNESLMNGTVTMSVSTTGIKADSFNEAKKKVKALPNVKNVEIIYEAEDALIFNIPQKELFKVKCVLRNTELKVI